MRNYRGMDYNGGYPLTELSLDNIKKILPPAFLAQIKRVVFNGNLGDFGLARDAVEIVQYLVENQVQRIHISTNGSMRTPDWWARLALPGVQIGWGLDGLADTHSLYRQDTDWNTIIKNAQAFIAAGGRAIWRFIPFDHNRHQMAECKELAKKLGFFKFDNIDGGRNQGPAYHRDGTFSHWIGRTYQPPPPIEAMLESHVTWFNSKTIQHAKDTKDLVIGCNHKRQKELYLAADGTVYPCCYLGFYPGSMHQPGNAQLVGIVKENNALDHSLEHCIAWFDRVEESWSRQSIADGRIYTCVNTCGNWQMSKNPETL
jgi:sulfatase maturation enzyme AslB (radical SAM superfamily)